MTQPLVSVIIPCYNHGEYLPEAVESVTRMERKDVELVVVDDGSTDTHTVQELNRLAERGIRIVRQENCGLATARNAGIRATSAPFILPLDADNRLRPAYIEHGLRVLEANPNVGVVYGDAEYFGAKSGRWSVGKFDRDRLLWWNYIDACAMYRRSVWVSTGGYDAAMPVMGVEDWDFWLGAIENGWEFAYVPEVLFDYRVVPDSMVARIRGHEREIELFVAKKHGWLYRQTWQELERKRHSFRALGSQLLREIASRLRPAP